MDMLASFMRDVSHEFRTPLSIINGQMYLLERAGVVPPEQQKRLKVMREASDYIDELVGALFEMVRLDSGVDLDLVDLNLDNVIQDLVRELHPAFQAKDLSLRLELADSLPLIEADKYQIGKALEKLVRNAIDHSPVGQEIVIRSAVVGGNAVISVVDSGPGIPANALPYIFERFYRGDRARTTRGAGLGLSIACKIMQMHEGCIDVETAVGKGSTFHMWLPINGQKPPAHSPSVRS
jgi:two-component system OmpR family sensor kinase